MVVGEGSEFGGVAAKTVADRAGRVGALEDQLCAEYQQAGADIVDPVASRPSGMRDFVVRDPDGHSFRLGRGEERLRELADQYGLSPDEIAVDPDWLAPRRRRT